MGAFGIDVAFDDINYFDLRRLDGGWRFLLVGVDIHDADGTLNESMPFLLSMCLPACKNKKEYSSIMRWVSKVPPRHFSKPKPTNLLPATKFAKNYFMLIKCSRFGRFRWNWQLLCVEVHSHS